MEEEAKNENREEIIQTHDFSCKCMDVDERNILIDDDQVDVMMI